MPFSLVQSLRSDALMAAHVAAAAEDDLFCSLEVADVVAWQRQRQQRRQTQQGLWQSPTAVTRAPPLSSSPAHVPCPANWCRFASEMCGRVRTVAALEALEVPRESGVERAAALLRAHRPLVQALVGCLRDHDLAGVVSLPLTSSRDSSASMASSSSSASTSSSSDVSSVSSSSESDRDSDPEDVEVDVESNC